MYICRVLKQRNVQTGWYIVVLYIIYAILLPLFQDGMFTDGAQYAAVARNLALGKGTIWHPVLADNLHNPFHQQPLLMQWLQGLFFAIFGTENIYPERIYCAVFLALSVWMFTKQWKAITRDTNSSWWPVIIWLSVPTITWGFINNVSENTMSFFDMVSVYFIYRYMAEKANATNMLWAIVFLFLASFTKGIQGLFPIAAPVLYCWAVDRKIITQKAFVSSLVLLISTIALYALLIQIPEAKDGYKQYFESRFPNFPNTPHSNTDNRLLLLSRLAAEMLVPAIVIAALSIANYFRNKKSSLQKSNPAVFFMLVALSASLPIMVSYEQRGFYLNTSIPYFALALALWFNPANSALNSLPKPNMQRIAFILVAVIGIGFAIFMAGKPKRDADKLADVQTLRALVGNNTIIYTNTTLWGDWSFHNYLQRYAQISLSLDQPVHGYFVVAKGAQQNPPAGFIPIAANTKFVAVYKK